MSRARDLADGTFDTLKVFDSALTDSLTLSVDTASSYAGTVTQDDTGLTFNNNTAIRGYTFKNNTSNTIIILDSDGLKFNGDTASANALDDYEEGTWTPTFNYGSATVNNPRYTKIGNVVTVHVLVQSFTDKTTAGNLDIGGLPFTAASNSYHVASTLHRYINAGADSNVQAYIPDGQSYMSFYGTRANNSYIRIRHDHLNGNSALFFISITYRSA